MKDLILEIQFFIKTYVKPSFFRKSILVIIMSRWHIASFNMQSNESMTTVNQGCGNTMPDLSHFIQDKLKISIYLSLDKYNV